MNMDSMFGGGGMGMSPFGGGDPFSLLRGPMSAIPAGDGDGHFQSFQSSYCSDGKRVVEHSRQLRRAPGQVAEMKERRSDTGAGKQMMAVQAHTPPPPVTPACLTRTHPAAPDWRSCRQGDPCRGPSLGEYPPRHLVPKHG